MPGRLTRLTRRSEFLKVASRGRKAARPGLVLQAMPQPEGGLRLGFTATKKIGNAVVRNRAKRRLREAARLMLGAAPPEGWDLVLLSSVMQYIENPFDMLRKIIASGIPHIVIDRTPCFDQDQDLLTVQRVPPEIYEASYPCWIFSRTGLLRALQPRYRLVAAFSDPAGPLQGPGLKFDLGGFMFDLENSLVRDNRAVLRRNWGLVAVTAYVGIVVWNFIWFWPVFTAWNIPYGEWHTRMWLPSWV